MSKDGECTGEGRYSDPDELEEEKLGEEEIISIGVGWATLRLGAELVMSECVDDEDIKGRRRLTSE